MKKESRREHNPVKARSRKAIRHAARLAPLEEHLKEQASAASANGNPVSTPDTDEPKLLPGIAVEERKSRRFLGMHPVVAFIFVAVMTFIAFITYLISIEPPR